MKVLLALSLCALASAAHATSTLADFEGYSAGDAVGNVGGLGGINFVPPGTVQAGGVSGNFLFLAPAPGFNVPTEQIFTEYGSFLNGGDEYWIRSSISALDVMSASGVTMFWGLGGHNVALLSPGEWYHFDVNTSHSIKFHSDGGSNLDNLLFGQTSGAIPEPGTWAMMLAGFGVIGISLRFRRKSSSARAWAELR